MNAYALVKHLIAALTRKKKKNSAHDCVWINSAECIIIRVWKLIVIDLACRLFNIQICLLFDLAHMTFPRYTLGYLQWGIKKKSRYGILNLAHRGNEKGRGRVTFCHSTGIRCDININETYYISFPLFLLNIRKWFISHIVKIRPYKDS